MSIENLLNQDFISELETDLDDNIFLRFMYIRGMPTIAAINALITDFTISLLSDLFRNLDAYVF